MDLDYSGEEVLQSNDYSLRLLKDRLHVRFEDGYWYIEMRVIDAYPIAVKTKNLDDAIKVFAIELLQSIFWANVKKKDDYKGWNEEWRIPDKILIELSEYFGLTNSRNRLK